MNVTTSTVYQFKITLKGIRPPVWRRIQVPSTYTFWDLHVAIQDAMGWLDYHLHEFDVPSPSTGLPVRIGIPHEDFPMIVPILPGWQLRIADYFTEANAKANYYYDFGDDWRHAVLLEKMVPQDPSVRYPVCVAGRRACPPEDCGGTWGYSEFLRKLADSTDPGHKEMVEWIGGDFDPGNFDAADVYFDDPRERWQRAFGLEYGKLEDSSGPA
jgi:hypothetical protein